MLDEPITNFKNIILPMTFDNERKTVGIFRKFGFRHAKLPLDKHLKYV